MSEYQQYLSGPQSRLNFLVDVLPKHALLLINEKSRNGNTSVDAFVNRLRQRGLEIIQGKPQRPEQIPELIRQHKGRIDCAIIGGGDGSMSAAAPALLDTGVALGVLPLGTANDLARTLQIPSDPEQAADVITGDAAHMIDLGCVNGHYFFNVAHIGVGVDAKRLLTPEIKQRWGALGYPICVIRAVQQFRPFKAEIICDGRPHRVRSMQIAVGNGRHYGGGMTVADEARIDDGCFHLYSIEPLSWTELLKIGPALRSGDFQPQHPVDIEQGRTIEIRTRKPMPVTADGELVTRTPARFTMLPRAVKVLVPASYLERKQEELDNAA